MSHVAEFLAFRSECEFPSPPFLSWKPSTSPSVSEPPATAGEERRE